MKGIYSKSGLLLILFLMGYFCESNQGILYPRESESREVKFLDGIWSFRLDGQGKHSETGFKEKWYTKPLQESGNVELMPVPSSYNDITQKRSVRDHIGWVWYETTFFTPARWQMDLQRVFLRFGSANYFAMVWVNGEHVMNHTGGHLPFQADISEVALYGLQNLLVVALNNTLGPLTIPQGTLDQPTDHSRYPRDYVSQSYNFDYFHYAGIHRPVFIYTTPRFYIDDITVTTDISNNTQLLGILNFSIETKFHYKDNSLYKNEGLHCLVHVLDKSGHKVSLSRECSGVIDIPSVNLWWPYLSGPPDEPPGYLYTLEVHLTSDDAPGEQDVYRLPFGVRTVQTTNSSFLINGKPFYFRGFGRHEDSSIRGRGVDLALLVKDHNLIQWTGANSYRTSHYPYAEEILDLTDKLGIVIIDESPAIGLSGFDDALLANHVAVMNELVQRDKNRASVLMWSIGNEPRSMEQNSTVYFDKVINQTRAMDPMKRPVTLVLNDGFPQNKAPSVDVFSLNRYFAWYGDTGRLEVIQMQLVKEVKSWFDLYERPILITEYGAGSIAGMHTSPSFTWTEDFQVDYHLEHFKSFDSMRRTLPYFIGEMIWNFADFATPQETFRPWGCMKGIFTRERQPKRIAHFVRRRYWDIANGTCGHALPADLI